ncbi:ABC transporter permease [Trinickia sp. EG282A]|uniref:ABC transporter permease n=1 Tax=Trinickia sp. EG282A TaxID=3237013 RepID=UPI0034D38976
MPDRTDASSARPSASGRIGVAMAGRRSLSLIRPKRLLAWAITLGLVVLFAFGWELASRRGWVDPFFVSRPSALAYQLFDWWHGGTSNGPLAVHVGVTLAEAALGVAAGSILGAACAFLFRAGTLRGDVFALFVWLLRPAPVVALAGALGLGLGFGIAARAAFATILVFLVAFADARASRPAFETVRWRCGLALAGAVLGECFVARSGIGFLIARAVQQFNAGGVYAALVVLVAIGVVVDLFAGALERAWRRRAAPIENGARPLDNDHSTASGRSNR